MLYIHMLNHICDSISLKINIQLMKVKRHVMLEVTQYAPLIESGGVRPLSSDWALLSRFRCPPIQHPTFDSQQQLLQLLILYLVIYCIGQ